MAQFYTSKNTSVNNTKLPAIYHKLWLTQLYHDIVKERPVLRYGAPLIYDYGCGKETNHIENHVKKYGFQYFGYDKYHEEHDGRLCMPKTPDIIICSNVLNVIDNNAEVNRIHNFLRNMGCPYFISVYEGDKSGIGKETKKDCWQRNKPYDYYLYEAEVSKYKIITRPQYIHYITMEHN